MTKKKLALVVLGVLGVVSLIITGGFDPILEAIISIIESD